MVEMVLTGGAVVVTALAISPARVSKPRDGQQKQGADKRKQPFQGKHDLSVVLLNFTTVTPVVQ